MIMGEAGAAAVQSSRSLTRGTAWATSSRSGSAPSPWPTGASGFVNANPDARYKTPTLRLRRGHASGARKSLGDGAFSHQRREPLEEPPCWTEAVRRVCDTVAVIRTQAPFIHVMSSPTTRRSAAECGGGRSGCP